MLPGALVFCRAVTDLSIEHFPVASGLNKKDRVFDNPPGDDVFVPSRKQKEEEFLVEHPIPDSELADTCREALSVETLRQRIN